MATHDWRTGWDDQRHPIIKDMIDHYLRCTNGHVCLAEILDAVGKRQNDLPTLPKYVHPASGCPFLCWLSVLGKCTFKDCQYRKEGAGRPLPGDITDEFANQLIDAINNLAENVGDISAKCWRHVKMSMNLGILRAGANTKTTLTQDFCVENFQHCTPYQNVHTHKDPMPSPKF
jgi:hypothetical protein